MKVFDKKVGETTYYKYRINLPKEIVEKFGFLDEELSVRFDNGKMIVEKNKNLKGKKTSK